MNNEEIKLLEQHYSVKPEFPNRIYYICEICGKELHTFKSQISTDPKYHHYCCKEHQAIAYKILLKGRNNPNWNHRWNSEQRNHQSETIRKNFEENPEYRYKCGVTNRGKTKDTCEHLKRASEKRKEGIASGRIIVSRQHSKESKIKIGLHSKQFMNDPKTKEHYRKLNEENGNWLPLEQVSDWEIYQRAANWKHIKTDKILVRDHIYGRRAGYTNKVFPEILRHPCNLQYISRRENLKKVWKTKERDAGQTLDELFYKIEHFSGIWEEQQLCLELINRYKNGERWTKNSI